MRAPPSISGDNEASNQGTHTEGKPAGARQHNIIYAISHNMSLLLVNVICVICLIYVAEGWLRTVYDIRHAVYMDDIIMADAVHHGDELLVMPYTEERGF